MILEKVNIGNIYYNDNQVIHTREYYNYCVRLLKDWLTNNDEEINIIFGDYNIDFINDFRVIRVDIQCEHTLVKEGGRSVGEKYYGQTNTDEGGKYLVRIDKFNYYDSLDFIFEYSYPNTHNIKTSGHFDRYVDRIINISPTMYDPEFSNKDKLDTITLFSNNSSARRDSVTRELSNKDINCTNIDNCFSSEDLIKQYNKTRIMLNVHQTDHHHTFEELRVLPALTNGILIVSEDVPLKEYVPYHEHIIWSSYDKLTETLTEVQENYEEYHAKLFNNKLNDLLLSLKEVNNENLKIINKRK